MQVTLEKREAQRFLRALKDSFNELADKARTYSLTYVVRFPAEPITTQLIGGDDVGGVAEKTIGLKQPLLNATIDTVNSKLDNLIAGIGNTSDGQVMQVELALVEFVQQVPFDSALPTKIKEKYEASKKLEAAPAEKANLSIAK